MKYIVKNKMGIFSLSLKEGQDERVKTRGSRREGQDERVKTRGSRREGQDEWVICREFDRNIKLVSGMVLGGTHVCFDNPGVCIHIHNVIQRHRKHHQFIQFF